jgi:hypothetical protein
MKQWQIVLLFFFCNIIFPHHYCYAQITFQKTFGDTGGEGAVDVRQTTDGGYIIAGGTLSFGAGASDIYVIKTDSAGNILWTKTFGGANADGASSIRQTLDSGYIIVGSTHSFGSQSNIFVLKENSAGNLQWAKTIGMPGGAESGSLGLQMANGSYVIFGDIPNVTINNQHGIFLGKLSSNGSNLLWGKMLGHSSQSNHWFQNSSGLITSDGGFLLLGETNYFNTWGDLDIYLFKTDGNGNLLWAKTYGGLNDDSPSSIIPTSDNNYIITGKTNSFGAGSEDIYLLKVDTAGNLLWSKTYGGTLSEYGNSLVEASDKGIIITGLTSSIGFGFTDAFMMKTDSVGNPLWTYTYGGINGDYGYSASQTNDGGYIVCGSTNSFGLGGSDFYLIKTDNAGRSHCNEMQDTFTVSIAATNVNIVNPIDSPYVSAQTVTPIVNSGGSSYLLCLLTGEKEVELSIEENTIAVYPNPASNEIFVLSSMLTNENTVSVINMVGETLFKTNSNSEQLKIDIQDYPPGVYFVTLTDKKNTRVMKKFVKL